MKRMIVFFAGFVFFSSILFAQEERKVLVEVFTNSHCPLCPAAHNVIDNYLAGPNGDKISYIFYHMVYPYSDDLLYQQSMEDSDARHTYYNPPASTPRGFFDGQIQGSPSGWTASLDNLVATQSPLNIILSGTRNATQFNINAELTRVGNIPDNDLAIHFVVIENIFYNGRNSVSYHKHVMRKMLPTPNGQPFSINLNETKNISQNINIDSIWDADSLSVIVFVQSTGSKTVYQSESINYNDLVVSVNGGRNNIPNEFILEQNYPNPFNPNTTISFSIPEASFVSLKVYNSLGENVGTIVSKELNAGFYNYNWNAENLTSGIYFYTITADNFAETKKMTYLK